MVDTAADTSPLVIDRRWAAHTGDPAEFALAALLVVAAYGIPQVLLPYGVALSAAVGIAAVAAVTYATVLISRTLFATFWLLLVVGQNAIAGIWYPGGPVGTPLATTELKTAALAVAAVVLWPAVRAFASANRRMIIAAAAFAVLIVVNLRHPSGATVPYLRNFFGPILAVIVFGALAQSMDARERHVYIYRVSTQFALLLALGTFLEMFLGTPAWRDLVHASASDNLASLSTSTTLLDFRLGRVGGFFVEPTNAGYAAAATLIAVLLGWHASRRDGIAVGSPVLAASLAGFCLLMSGAKNGVLIIVLGGFAFWAYGPRGRPVRAFVTAGALSFGFVLLYVGVVKGFGHLASAITSPISVVGGSSTTFHLAGALYGIPAGIAAPIGHGLGVGGDFTRFGGSGTGGVTRAAWKTWLSTGSESAWGVLAYQLGIIGLGVWLWFMTETARQWGRASGALLAAWAASALFAEAQLGLPIAGTVVFVAAMLSDAPRIGAVTDEHAK